MAEGKPGYHIEFFFLADYEKEKVHARHSLLYDVDAVAGRMVISQPSPPLPESRVGQKILLTCLSKKGGHLVRFGFPAKIIRMLAKYQIASHHRLPALLIQQQDSPRLLNVRLSFRVKLTPSDGLALRIGREKSNLLNICLGGAVISEMTAHRLHAQDRVRITVIIDGREYGLDAVVVRAWSSAACQPYMACPYMAALKFMDLPNAFNNALGKKILSLERKWLVKDALLR